MLVAAVAALVAAHAVPFFALRAYARRIDRRVNERREKTYRLSLAFVATGSRLAIFLGGPTALASTGMLQSVFDLGSDIVILSSLSVEAVLFNLGMLGSYLALRPWFSQPPVDPRWRRPAVMRLMRWIPASTIPPVAAIVVMFTVRGTIIEVVLLALVLPWIFYLGMVVSLTRNALRGPSRPADAFLRNHLSDVCRRLGLDVRAVVVQERLSKRVANLFLVPSLPGFQFLVVTDYLLQEFPQAEVDALLAHDVSDYRTRRWVPVVYAAALTLFGLTSFGLALVSGLVVLYGMILALVAFLAFGYLTRKVIGGVALERRADDLAAQAVGYEPTISSLERVAQVSEFQPRERGAYARGHPGLGKRAARLRQRAVESLPGHDSDGQGYAVNDDPAG